MADNMERGSSYHLLIKGKSFELRKGEVKAWEIVVEDEHDKLGMAAKQLVAAGCNFICNTPTTDALDYATGPGPEEGVEGAGREGHKPPCNYTGKER